MNTVKHGIYRWMVYKEGDTWIGVALEFNIVVTGEDPRLVEFELQESVLGHLESAKKLTKGFRSNQVNGLLNQKADGEYETKWSRATQTSASSDGPVISPLSNVYKAGIANLANV